MSERQISVPVSDSVIGQLQVGDKIWISGRIFCGRDAVLPKIEQLIRENRLSERKIDLNGALIFHTAVSRAGVGPTSSNKYEIESRIPILSEAGVKIHLGKGEISRDTICALDLYHSVYAVIPPVTALLEAKTREKRVIAFPELGMEAFYELEVEGYPAIIAAAKGKSIYD